MKKLLTENSRTEFLKNLLKNHLVIILFYFIFTIIFTFPNLLNFENVITYRTDSYVFLSTFFWYNHSLSNLESLDLWWIFWNDYQFYPIGAFTGGIGSFNSILSPILFLIVDSYVKVFNIFILFGFVLSGYGSFLLAKHLTKNYFAAIIAGLVFGFGVYHAIHYELSHLSLISTQFIPFTLLYLIKTREQKNKKNPIIAGIFLFFVLIISFNTGLFMLIFLFSYIIYLIFKKEKFQVHSKIVIILIIGIFLSMPLYYGHYVATKENPSPFSHPLSQFIGWSSSPTDYFLPTKSSLLYQNVSDSKWIPELGERSAFLGYSAIILALICIIKTDRLKKEFWIISGVVLAVISFGPFFKIFTFNTGIPLPYLLVYDLPYFELFRVMSRASIFVTLSFSILVAYGTNEILKLKQFPNNKQILVFSLLVFLVGLELLVSFPLAEKPEVPEIYSEIGAKERDFVVLESPIGRIADNISIGLESNYEYLFYQTIHGKPIYSGGYVRVPNETQRYVQTYFLNQFIWNQPSHDIIDQNLSEFGVSILNYFDIGYVIVHYYADQQLNDYLISKNCGNGKNLCIQEHMTKKWIPQTKATLFEIFSKPPDYEDEELFAYKVPKSNSTTPFILLGEGWSPLIGDYRTFDESGIIKLINPQDKSINVTMNFQTQSVNPINLIVQFNGEKISTMKIISDIQIPVLTLELFPGENLIKLEKEKNSNIYTEEIKFTKIFLD